MCKDGFLCGESEKVPLDGRSRVDEAAMGNIGSPHNGHDKVSSTEIYSKVTLTGLKAHHAKHFMKERGGDRRVKRSS